MAFARKEEALRQKASMKEAGLAVKERARREKEESREKERKAKEEGKKKKQELKEAKKAEEKRIKAAVEEVSVYFFLFWLAFDTLPACILLVRPNVPRVLLF